MNGQLWDNERIYLHNAILHYKPEIVLEVGTWKGGGSTWQIFNALKKNEKGCLYTCEVNKEFFDEAKSIYGESEFIKLHNESSDSLISKMLCNGTVPDFLFFDGPEDESTALNNLLSLEPHLKLGTIYSMHDFDAPSIKARKARPYLENSFKWKLISKLVRPESVGICLWEKVS